MIGMLIGSALGAAGNAYAAYNQNKQASEQVRKYNESKERKKVFP